MKTWFKIFLIVLFAFSFWWGGGDRLIRDYVPASTNISQSFDTAGRVWDRLYRIIALKSTVNAKIDKKNYVKIQDIPLTLQQAVIAVEDSRFYHHYGFDVEGILRAALVNLQTGSIAEGGSTITQQLVRNLFLTQERSMMRKAEEIVLAIDMEMRYSKEEILEMYLNTVYFGSGTYGVGQASRGYFGKAPSQLTLAESAMLAGLPNAPSLISPYVDFTAAKQRQAVVLAAMVRNGYIGPSQAEEARLAPIRLAK